MTTLSVAAEPSALARGINRKLQARVTTDASSPRCVAANGFVLHFHNYSAPIAFRTR
jgi:hypothetical protein